MAARTAKKYPEPREKSPLGWARWWFAMGAGEPGTIARLVAECGIQEADAASCYQVMMDKIKEETATLRETIGDQAAALYRQIKCDLTADWSSRQRAQIELEKLLDLVAYAQTPEGKDADDVHEAIAFHRQLIDASGTTPGQRLRSQTRLMRLLGYTGRRAVRRSQPAPESPLPGPVTAPRRTEQVHSPAPAAGHELDEATRIRLTEELKREAAEYDAEFERLVEQEGFTPEAACELLEERVHENALRQFAVQQMALQQMAGPPLPAALAAGAVASREPPEPHAQGPPA